MPSWKVIFVLQGGTLENVPMKSVVTIGVFDGVHIGHQKIIKGLLKEAAKRRCTPVVVTFSPHPNKVLHKSFWKTTITSLQHRLNLLESLGIEKCIIIRFTSAFSKRSPEWFIEKVLIDKLNAKALVVGEGFRLGGGNGADTPKLASLARQYGLYLKVVPAEKYKSKAISSSQIRELIKKGDFKLISRLLAREFSIIGTVVKGRRVGRDIGFKTANIIPHQETIPSSGVYAVKVKTKGKFHYGLLNTGRRPTFGGRQRRLSIEVHLLDFKGSLYGKDIQVAFLKKIRPEKRFKSKESLASQIQKDVYYLRKYIKRDSPST